MHLFTQQNNLRPERVYAKYGDSDHNPSNKLTPNSHQICQFAKWCYTIVGYSKHATFTNKGTYNQLFQSYFRQFAILIYWNKNYLINWYMVEANLISSFSAHAEEKLPFVLICMLDPVTTWACCNKTIAFQTIVGFSVFFLLL